jgi:transcriptional regulator with XRE-family HTH domain
MIGKKILSLRKKMGFTLQQVSESSGLSTAFLSQVERELSSPSVASLASIARALDVNPSYFFPPPQGNGLLVRGYARHPFQMDHAEVVYARLGGDFPGRSLEPLHATYPPGYESEMVSHEGEEFYYILSGQLIIQLDGEEFRLNTEDTFHFPSTRPHCLANRGDAPVHVIAVTTPTLLQ